MTYAAILKKYTLPEPKVLEKEWAEQIKYTPNHNYGKLLELNLDQLDFYTDFFRNLLLDLKNLTGEIKNTRLQVSLPEKKDKGFLSLVHKDYDRNAALTIPILVDPNEPLNYYSEETIAHRGIKSDYEKGKTYIEQQREQGNAQRFLSSNHQQRSKVLKQVFYSPKYPTLINTNINHAVRIIDLSYPRVLLQLSYNRKFEEIIQDNPDYWEII